VVQGLVAVAAGDFREPELLRANCLPILLEWFPPVDPGVIPDKSIPREFLGGSILTEFNPWKPPSLDG
jgi:hypothetical protein